jgi:hypothetical protein
VLRPFSLSLLSFSILLPACVAQRPLPSGVYQQRGKDYVARLELTTQDSTFRYSYQAFEVNAKCQGTWVQRRDTLYLRCAPEAFPAQLSRGYFSNRTPTAVVRRGNRLHLDSAMLKMVR